MPSTTSPHTEYLLSSQGASSKQMKNWLLALFWLLALLSLALNVVLAWKIARGRNWARVVLLVLQIIVLGNLLRTLLEQHGFTIFPSETLVMLFLRPALAIVALVLVFGPGRAWFAPR